MAKKEKRRYQDFLTNTFWKSHDGGDNPVPEMKIRSGGIPPNNYHLVQVKNKNNVMDDDCMYFEGCACLGYFPEGDSFMFSQCQGKGQYGEKQIIFCLSRHILEKILREYPSRNNEDKTCTISYKKLDKAK